MTASNTADDAWEVAINTITKGLNLMFTNDFDGSEATFKEGMERGAPAHKEDFDARGVCAYLYSLISLGKGVASFSDDQLSECLTRLKKAEKLTNLDKDWIGKKGVRGLCILSVGLIELVEHSYVKGIYNILRSWKYIKLLRTEGIQYAGREAPVVRSTALLAVSNFYLLYSFLPPTASKVVAWFSGFEGDRNKGLAMMRQCWQEGGISATHAALGYLSYYTDTVTFIGHTLTTEEETICKEMIEWGDTKYPNSLFFSLVKADFQLLKRNSEGARAIMLEAKPHFKLPGLIWALHYKLGSYHLNGGDYFMAGKEFEESLDVYLKAKRRSMVPYMAAYSLLCYLRSVQNIQATGGDTSDALAGVKRVAEILENHKKMKKKNWGRQDVFGFGIYKRYKNTTESVNWVLMDITHIMVLQVRSTWGLTMLQIDNLEKALLEDKTKREKRGIYTVDDQVNLLLAQSEFEFQRNNIVAALDKAVEGIDLEKKVSKEQKKRGAIPMLCYMSAFYCATKGDLERAKKFMKKLKGFGSSYDLHGLIFLKAIVLSQNIGEEFVQDYEEISVGARAEQTVEKTVQAGVVEWSWFVEKHSISFRAEFSPKDTTQPTVVIQSIGKHDTEKKHLIGEYHPETDGTLRLCWDNSFSKFRSKRIHYKVVERVKDE